MPLTIMKTPLTTIRCLEEISLNAWPALQTVCLDGWLLRFAEGYTRRANSVQPLYPAIEDGTLMERIAQCERLYARAHRPTIFKMTDAALPGDLDAVLAERGYSREAETSVHILDLRAFALPAPVAGQISINSQLSEEWLTAYLEMANIAAPHRPVLRQMLSNIVVPSTAYAMLRCNGEMAAVGMAVSERGYVGLFDIHTSAPWRGQGLGTQLVTALLTWGRDEGANCAYLQVMRDNPPALHLYAKLGFAEAYGYWYRVKAED
jgi:N-acetylglutamate synthase